MVVWVFQPSLAMVVVVLLVLYGIAASGHFLFFVLTVGSVATGGILFVRWCWDCQDRRRRERDLARVERSFNRKEEP